MSTSQPRIVSSERTSPPRMHLSDPERSTLAEIGTESDAKVFKKYSQMKLQMKREALAKIDRKANDKGSSGTGEAS